MSEPRPPKELIELPIAGMTCTACATRIERALNRLPGVEAHVNASLERASIEKSLEGPGLATLIDTIEKTGYQVPRQTIDLAIRGMTCASCVGRVTKALERLPGVNATVNLATESASVSYLPSTTPVTRLVEAVRAAGYDARPETTDQTADVKRDRGVSLDLIVGVVLTTPLLVHMLATLAGATWVRHWPMVIDGLLASPVQFWVGRRFYRGAWHALRDGSANMDVLVVLGTTAAYLLSVTSLVLWPDRPTYFDASAAVITLVLFGKDLEGRAKHRARAALTELASLIPAIAHREQAGTITDVPPDSLAPDEVFVVRPGERVPADGIVIEGSSAVSEALLTGESQPVPKKAGDLLYAGTENQIGILRVRTTGTGATTAVAAIVRLVSRAQASRAPVQQAADRVAAVFVPVVLAIAAVSFLGWWITGAGLPVATINAVSVLVIACPCTLGLAIPTAVLVATTRGAQVGLLVTKARALEMARHLTVMVFDKTGTLTHGTPTVVGVHDASQTTEDWLPILLTLEQRSEHPLAAAICDYAGRLGLRGVTAIDYEVEAGRGISAVVAGTRWYAGAPAYVSERASAPAPRKPGTGTLVAIGRAGELAGWVELHDPPRPEARAVVRALRDRGIRCLLASGDRPEVVQAIAHLVGITEFLAGQTPEDKASLVTRLRAEGARVGMVGDGVNDAPALASADVSFTLATGADISREAADMVLLRGLDGVLASLDLSRAAVRKIHQNLFFAFVYNSLGLPLAALGWLSPVFSGAAMAMSSVSVVSNSLLLKRWQPPALPTPERTSHGTDPV